MDSSTSTARVWVKPISIGLAIGPPACSFRSAARPSQNCARFRLEFSTVGELIGPCCQLWPMEVGRLSVPPMDRLWQELQEMKPDLDRRGSKYSCLPSSTLAGLVILAGSIGWIGSLLGVMAKALALRLRPRASIAGLNMVGGSYCSSGLDQRCPWGHLAILTCVKVAMERRVGGARRVWRRARG